MLPLLVCLSAVLYKCVCWILKLIETNAAKLNMAWLALISVKHWIETMNGNEMEMERRHRTKMGKPYGSATEA